MNKQRCAVLLATFNGKAWVGEQIQSILDQKSIDIDIFICDDISTDETINYILENFDDDSRVNIIRNSKKFKCAAKNFYNLILDSDYSNYDYICFADQDDIWDKEKIISATKKLCLEGSIAYSSNVIAFWDDRLKTIMIKKSQKQTKLDYFFEAPGPGCTFVMKRSFFNEFRLFLKENFTVLEGFSAHDWLVYAYARHRGFNWSIDPKPYMFYRQHSSNQLGINKGLRQAFKRWKAIKNGDYKRDIMILLKFFDSKSSSLDYLRNENSIISYIRFIKGFWQYRRRVKDKFSLLVIIILGHFK